MDNYANVRLLTKAEVSVVAGGGAESVDDETEIISISAPRYPPLNYTTWLSQQSTTTWTVSGDVSGVVVSAGGAVATTGYDTNNDGKKDTNDEMHDFQIIEKLMLI